MPASTASCYLLATVINSVSRSTCAVRDWTLVDAARNGRHRGAFRTATATRLLDEVIKYEDVELPPNRLADDLREEQYAHFPPIGFG
jgi:hypothetical protein